MPKYTYKCLECLTTKAVRHSISERYTTCETCGASALVRVPSGINIQSNIETDKEAVGSLVKEHIESTREEIEAMKKRLVEGFETDE